MSSSMHKTPASLLERLRRPDEPDAWRRFVHLYTPLLLGWARRFGLQDPDAAYLVQEVFVVLLQEMPRFQYDPHKRFRGWLRTIMVNKLAELFAVRVVAPVGSSQPAAQLREQIVLEAFERGLLLLGCGERTVRFCPPLCITSGNVCTALTIFDQVVAQVLAAASGRPTGRAAIAS